MTAVPPEQPDTVNAVIMDRAEANDTRTQRVFALNILCVLLRN